MVYESSCLSPRWKPHTVPFDLEHKVAKLVTSAFSLKLDFPYLSFRQGSDVASSTVCCTASPHIATSSFGVAQHFYILSS